MKNRVILAFKSFPILLCRFENGGQTAARAFRREPAGVLPLRRLRVKKLGQSFPDNAVFNRFQILPCDFSVADIRGLVGNRFIGPARDLFPHV